MLSCMVLFCKGGIVVMLLLLTTPLTLVCGGEADHPAFGPPSSLSLQRGLSTNPGVTMWCVCGCS